MTRRPPHSTLALERLEPRDVPAVVLPGTFTGSTADGTFRAVPTGGAVVVTEIGGSFVAFGPNGLNAVLVTKPETSPDAVLLENAGGRVVLHPANERLEPMVFPPNEVAVFGKVVTVLRRVAQG